ncbi:MAG: ABC transporter permease [Phycisphaeraceae bacterium]
MKRFFSRLVRNKAATAALVVIVLLGGCALAAPWLAPYAPLDQDYSAFRSAPDSAHWLGTDGSGRDVLSRLLYGARISFQVAGVSVAFALLVGGMMGLCAGYFGGWIDEVVSRMTDMLFAFPDIVLALVIMAALGEGRWNLVLAIGVVYTPIFARVARGSAMAIKRQPYVESAHAIGAGPWRTILRHILPNSAAPLLVQATLSLALAILAEGALSFLGLGVEPDAPSWGIMLREGKDLALQNIWWVAVFPGIAITALVLSFNLLGDGLRDALDPRT